MSRAQVDHNWTHIYHNHSNYIGGLTVREKIDEVKRVLEKLDLAKPTDSNTKLKLELHRILTALIRCRQFICSELDLTHDDLHINYRFATDSMLANQEALDKFLAECEAELSSPA